MVWGVRGVPAIKFLVIKKEYKNNKKLK